MRLLRDLYTRFKKRGSLKKIHYKLRHTRFRHCPGKRIQVEGYHFYTLPYFDATSHAMIKLIPIIITIGAVLSSCFVCQAFGTEFLTHELPEGITIQVPSHWRVLSKDMRKNIRAATEAMAEQSGVSLGKATNVFHVNATPDPTGAIVRVTIGPPPPFTAAELKDASQSDLIELKNIYENQMRAFQKSGGPELIESYLPRIESISGISSIAWSYRRKSATGHGAWYVTQYKIPCKSILVELTISYRENDSGLWKPILTKVRGSVRIPDRGAS